MTVFELIDTLKKLCDANTYAGGAEAKVRIADQDEEAEYAIGRIRFESVIGGIAMTGQGKGSVEATHSLVIEGDEPCS